MPMLRAVSQESGVAAKIGGCLLYTSRLAARLTGWHIDIKSASFTGESLAPMDNMLIDEDEAADDEAGLCAYVGEDGVRCRNHARPGSRYCGVHADLDEA